MTLDELRRQSRDAVLELEARAETLFKRSMRRVLKQVRAKLGVVVTAAGAPVSPDDLGLIAALWDGEIDTELLPFIDEVFRAGAIAVGDEMPDALAAQLAAIGQEAMDKFVSKRALDHLAQARNRLALFGDDLWREARSALHEGTTAGESVNQLGLRVSKVLDTLEWQGIRVARSESSVAANQGALAGAKALGEFGPQTKTFLATEDSRTCIECSDLDGETVAIDETFSNGDDAAGEVHASCRCTTLFGEQGERVSMMTLDDAYAEAARTEDTEGNVAAGGSPMNKLTAAGETPSDLATAQPDNGFHALMVREGIPTGDGRQFEPGSLEWRDLPIPLKWQKEEAEGHDGSVLVGRIDRIERQGNDLHAWGTFDAGSDPPNEDAQLAMRLVRDKMLNGVSVDVDDVSDSDVELIWPEVDPEADPMDELFIEPEMMLFHHGRVAGLTATPMPAFQEAWIRMAGADDPVDLPSGADTAPTGSGEPGPMLAVAGSAGGWVRANRSRGAYEGRASDPSGSSNRSPVQSAALRESGTSRSGDALGESSSRSGNVSRQGATDNTLPEGASLRGGQPLHRQAGTANLQGVQAGVVPSSVLGGPGEVQEASEGAPPQDEGVVPELPDELAAAIETWAGEQDGDLILSLGSLVRTFAGRPEPEPEPSTLDVLVASAIPVEPPAEWFTDPGFTVPQRSINVSPEGRVSGHLFAWNECHIGFGDVCRQPPAEDDFSFFTTGAVHTAEGEVIPVGQLTMGTGHADRSLSHRPAAAHYDNVEWSRADVTLGVDDHGAWFSGALRPDTTPEQVRQLRAAGISGDWRRIGGKLRLVAALAVNVRGFPIPRTSAGVVNGEQVSLVAAGLVTGGEAPSSPGLAPLADRLARSIGRDRKSRAASLAAVVKGAS